MNQTGADAGPATGGIDTGGSGQKEPVGGLGSPAGRNNSCHNRPGSAAATSTWAMHPRERSNNQLAEREP